MLGDLVKRVVNGVVLATAALAFFVVPLGRRTLAQHVVAIFTTPPAREAATACVDAAHLLVERASAQVDAIRARRKPRAPEPPPAD